MEIIYLKIHGDNLPPRVVMRLNGQMCETLRIGSGSCLAVVSLLLCDLALLLKSCETLDKLW